MVKKILISCLAVVLVAFTAYAYWRLQNTQNTSKAPTIELPVPPESIEALICINNNKYIEQEDLNNNQILKDLNKLREFEHFQSLFKEIMLTVRPKSKKTYVQLVHNGIRFDWVLLQPLSRVEFSLLKSNMESRWQLSDSLLYAQNSVLTYSRQQQKLFVGLTPKLALFSSSQIALEGCVRYQNEKTDWSGNEGVRELLKTQDPKAAVNVLINFEKAKYILDSYTGKKALFNPLLKWGVYDFYLKDNQVLLSGFSNTSNKYKATRAVRSFTSHEILPENTVAYEQFHADKCLSAADKTQRKFWEKYLDGEFLHAQVYDPRSASRLDDVWIIKTSQGAHVAEALANRSETAGKPVLKGSIAAGSKSYPTYTCSTALLSCFSEQSTGQLTVTHYNNYLLVGNSTSLSQILRANQNRRTFFKGKSVANFLAHIPEKGDYSFYLNPKMMQFWAKLKLSGNTAWRIKLGAKSWKNYNGFALRTEAKNNAQYVSGCIEFKPHQEQHARAIWACKLDTTLASRPITVLNHYTKMREVFVQDMHNKIYLISEKGVVLWSRNIGERIISKVRQVDYYKNGKLQLVFNTKNKIFLIDRVGRNVEKYPIALPYPATNGMAVFDYDKRKAYRFMVACLDKRIYAFDKTGQRVVGWNPAKTETEVENEIQHFRLGARDYISYADKNHTYLVNRRGQARVQYAEPFARMPQNPIYLEMNPAENRPYFVTSDEQGNIYHLSTTGRMRKITIDGFSNNHFFLYHDFNGDGLNDYIFLDNKKLRVYNQLQDEIFAYSFENQIFDSPIYFSFSTKKKSLGVYSRENAKVYLFDNTGELSNGFPISAESPFTITRLNPASLSFNILVGNEGRYLYNYALN